MARASTATLLSLDRFAQIVGITPAHFNGAKGTTYFPEFNNCSDIWYQYAWQQYDHISRENLAIVIKQAEDDLTAVLGYSPAPVWVDDDIQQYPQFHRRDMWQLDGLNVRGARKSVKAKYGRFILAGQRATTAIDEDAAVVYSDADGDGYDETATITVATTLTDECQLKCYFDGHGGEPEWEIRPVRSKRITGGNVVFIFWAWQLLDPDLQEAIPTSAGIDPIDLEEATNYVTTVAVYREYTDTTAVSAQFFWQPDPLATTGLIQVGICTTCGGSGCPACTLTSQDGCINVQDVMNGLVVPAPATYNSDTGQWDQNTYTLCRDPDQVKFWYYAGDLSQEYLAGRTCEPLSQYWAETIAWLATARAHNPFCGCNNTLTLVQEWQRDLSFTGSRELGQFQVSPIDLDNPFGTRYGEIKAWRRALRFAQNLMEGVVI